MKASRRWRGKCRFASRREQITEGTQRQSHFWISLEFSLVAKYNTRFIKKISQLNSDIQSYRCKNFSLKQVSGLMEGYGPPRTLPLGLPLLWCPLISFLQHSVIRTHQLLTINARAELETQWLLTADKIKKCKAPLEQKKGKKLFFSLTSYKRYNPKLVLF